MKSPIDFVTQLYSQALRNPKSRWMVILGSLLYLVSPLDLSPDLLPLIGQIDDIALLLLFATSISEIIREWWQTRQGFDGRGVDATGGDRAETSQQTIDVDAVSLD
jgi:uncharacterized membrane protein YkvA (DUF1232 family)